MVPQPIPALMYLVYTSHGWKVAPTPRALSWRALQQIQLSQPLLVHAKRSLAMLTLHHLFERRQQYPLSEPYGGTQARSVLRLNRFLQ